MPLRDLIYISDLLKKSTYKEDIYSSKKLSIPEPRFVVFYNGTDEQEDDLLYHLSDLYETESVHHDLELHVRVLNINNDCIERNILKEFFEKNRAEVISMWLYEYDEEKHLKNVHQEGREEERAAIRNTIILNIMKHDPALSREEAEKQADALMT